MTKVQVKATQDTRVKKTIPLDTESILSNVTVKFADSGGCPSILCEVRITDNESGGDQVFQLLGMGRLIRIRDPDDATKIIYERGFIWHGSIDLKQFSSDKLWLNVVLFNETAISNTNVDIHYEYSNDLGSSGVPDNNPDLRQLWTYGVNVKQDDATQQTITILIEPTEGNILELVAGHKGVDSTYGASRNIDIIVLQDSGKTDPYMWLGDFNDTGDFRAFPQGYSNSAQQPPALPLPVTIAGNMQLRVQAIDLAQNEEITIGIVGWCRTKPKVTISTDGTNITTTTEVDEIQG